MRRTKVLCRNNLAYGGSLNRDKMKSIDLGLKYLLYLILGRDGKTSTLNRFQTLVMKNSRQNDWF